MTRRNFTKFLLASIFITNKAFAFDDVVHIRNPGKCHSCESMPCFDVCPTDALIIDATGERDTGEKYDDGSPIYETEFTVTISYDDCTGCEDCIDECPKENMVMIMW